MHVGVWVGVCLEGDSCLARPLPYSDACWLSPPALKAEGTSLFLPEQSTWTTFELSWRLVDLALRACKWPTLISNFQGWQRKWTLSSPVWNVTARCDSEQHKRLQKRQQSYFREQSAASPIGSTHASAYVWCFCCLLVRPVGLFITWTHPISASQVSCVFRSVTHQGKFWLLQMT